MTDYPYTISTQTKYGQVDATYLTQQIVAAGLPGLDHIDTGNDMIDIWFAAALSGPQQATLTGVVAVHTGTPDNLFDVPSVSFLTSVIPGGALPGGGIITVQPTEQMIFHRKLTIHGKIVLLGDAKLAGIR